MCGVVKKCTVSIMDMEDRRQTTKSSISHFSTQWRVSTSLVKSVFSAHTEKYAFDRVLVRGFDILNITLGR